MLYTLLQDFKPPASMGSHSNILHSPYYVSGMHTTTKSQPKLHISENNDPITYIRGHQYRETNELIRQRVITDNRILREKGLVWSPTV